jgi:hypothetical protein
MSIGLFGAQGKPSGFCAKDPLAEVVMVAPVARSITTRVGIPLTLNRLERADMFGEPKGIAPVKAVISLK